jgi:hypothetical protein
LRILLNGSEATRQRRDGLQKANSVTTLVADEKEADGFRQRAQPILR